MKKFCLIVGCLFLWTYILNDTGLEVSVIQPWNARALCLCVFYQGPWLEGEEKGVIFVPSLPVIIFIMNLSLSVCQLGPVPIWRGLLCTRAALCMALSRNHLAWNSILFFFLIKKTHSSAEFQGISYLEFVVLKDLLSRERWEWFHFHLYLNKQSRWVPKYLKCFAIFVVRQRSVSRQYRFRGTKQGLTCGLGF